MPGIVSFHIRSCNGEGRLQPANNREEQVLYHAVIWHQLSFVTQRVASSCFVETMRSVIETCRPKNRDVLDTLTTALSLLPAP